MHAGTGVLAVVGSVCMTLALVANAGVPAWWPAWCLAYDVGAAGALAWLLTRADADVAGVTA
jgi:hypothetical protein